MTTTVLNLGCGARTSGEAGVVNVDWSIYLRLKKWRILRPVVPLFLRGYRLERFRSLPDNVLVHDLARGIPFDSGSVDVVYHSHLLEHLDRDVAERFLKEAWRVLKPGGIQRIVVPDFEKLCRDYLAHVERCVRHPEEAESHDSSIAPLLEQSVRREATGTSRQTLWRRLLENAVLGDARRRGETHQWAYDRVSLRSKLIRAGFGEVWVQDHATSLIPNWSDYRLDLDEQGDPYIPDSLYMEARK